MGVRGSIRTMALPDLLQWASVNRKSGLFQLHRNALIRGIAFKEGAIVACATNDPSLIAHYLIGGGRVRPEAMRAAVEQSRADGVALSTVVVDQGLITKSELEAQMADKSEETIYALFDWSDAEFSFEEVEPTPPLWVEVDTSVDEILLNGLQRLDEVTMIRKIFTSSGIVPEQTGNPAPKEIANSGMARRIIDSIDGQRSLAQILLSADASEFLVLKLLYHLFHKEVFQIARVLDREPGSATLLDDPDDTLSAIAQPVPVPPSSPSESAVPAAPQAESESQQPAKLAKPAKRQAAKPEASKPSAEEAALDPETLMSLAQVAKELEAGIEDGANAQTSTPVAPKQPVAEALIEFDLELTPVPLHTPERLAETELDSDEEYLVNVIDGSESLKGILTLAPLDHGRLMVAIRSLIDKKLINL